MKIENFVLVENGLGSLFYQGFFESDRVWILN